MVSANHQLFVLLFFAFLISFFISPSHQAQTTSLRPHALVLAVTKASATGQYVTQIKQRKPPVPVKLTVGLGGQLPWVGRAQGNVSSSYRPARCRSAQCSLPGSKTCTDDYCIDGPKPGCNNTRQFFPDNTRLLKINKEGYGGTKISTIKR